jgi:hypothetical protein
MREAGRVRALYADGNLSGAHAAERSLLRRFTLAVAAGELADPGAIAGVLDRELLGLDPIALVMEHRVEPAPAWRNEVQIQGGPRDGERVPYMGATMVDGDRRYEYQRIRSETGGSSHRYVPV